MATYPWLAGLLVVLFLGYVREDDLPSQGRQGVRVLGFGGVFPRGSEGQAPHPPTSGRGDRFAPNPARLERIVAALERHLVRERVDVAALTAEGAPAVWGGSGDLGGVAAAGPWGVVRSARR